MNEQQNGINEEMKAPVTEKSTTHIEQSDTLINGPLLLMLTVLLVLILSAMYYWFSTMSTPVNPVSPTVERPTVEENNEPESTTAEAQTETMLTTSPSDDLNAIEADLATTNLENLDTEMIAIEAEMNASMQSN
jgi:hypothetical protein